MSIGDTIFRNLSSAVKFCHDNPEQVDNQASMWVCTFWRECSYFCTGVEAAQSVAGICEVL